ncbi:hypothetical protein Tco_1186029, partial [Tanacetum coccineum]
ESDHIMLVGVLKIGHMNTLLNKGRKNSNFSDGFDTSEYWELIIDRYSCTSTTTPSSSLTKGLFDSIGVVAILMEQKSNFLRMSMETDIREKDKKLSKNGQNRAQNGKAWKSQSQI